MAKSAGGWVVFAIGILLLIVGIAIIIYDASDGILTAGIGITGGALIAGGIIVLAIQPRAVP